MSYQRVERIAEEIRRELSRILHYEVKDPRITEMVSIPKVEVSRDIRHAKIYISVLGNQQDKQDTMEGLKCANGFIRKELGHSLQLRHIPELHFVLDESIEYSIHIAKKLKELNQEDPS
jgi:ribosome-binding factor A